MKVTKGTFYQRKKHPLLKNNLKTAMNKTLKMYTNKKDRKNGNGSRTS